MWKNVFNIFQFDVAKRYMSSKRNVHHSRATASVDEERDSDSDDESDRVGQAVKIN